MRDPLLELQVFYEIAMSIGNSIDMQVVLRDGVKAYLRKLNVQAGAVFAFTKDDAPSGRGVEQLYSIPHSLDRNEAYKAAWEALEGLPQDELGEGLEILPIYRELREDLAFVLFPLEDFGALLLIARPERLDENLRHSLRPINAKLAQACIACRNAEALKAEILERQRSEHSLAESEEQLRLILRSVQAGIVIIDEETQEIVEVNAHAQRLLGRNEEDLIGKGCHGYIFPVIEEQPVLAGDSSFSENHESELLNPVRGRVSVIQNTNAIMLKGRRAVISSFVDVGAIRKAASERQRLELLLLQSQKMEAVGLLAGGIAHDFNNLLNVILNYNELAMDGMREDDPAKEDLREVQRASDRASELTRQLLAFSRKQVLKPVPLDLNQVAKQFERMLRRLLPEDINLVMSFAPDLGVTRADPGQVEQVLLNLAVNARDAMPDGGILGITTSNVEFANTSPGHVGPLHPGAYVQLAVSDTGYGMDEQTKARIFDPFFTTKELGKGTGLGLSTVYGIIKQSGGDIGIESAPGQGTVFLIWLPRERSTQSVAYRPEMAPTWSLGAETILVAEDEEALRVVVRRSLEKAGYRVLVARDGEDALALAGDYEGKIDLLLTDVVMPRMGGRALADALTDARPSTRVLFMSGYADKALGERGVLDDGIHFIEKPFKIADLNARVRAVLRTHLLG